VWGGGFMLTRIFGSKAGKFNIVTAFLSLVLAAAVFFGVMVVPKWMKNFKLKQEMYLHMVNAKNLTDAEIAARTVAYADQNGIPMNISEITCNRAGEVVRCRYEFLWPIAIGDKLLFSLTVSGEKERAITEVFNKLSKP
jgi:hypothetical protein